MLPTMKIIFNKKQIHDIFSQLISNSNNVIVILNNNVHKNTFILNLDFANFFLWKADDKSFRP